MFKKYAYITWITWGLLNFFLSYQILIWFVLSGRLIILETMVERFRQSEQRKKVLLAARISVYLIAFFNYHVLWKIQLHPLQWGALHELCQCWIASLFTLQLYQTEKSWRLQESECNRRARYGKRYIGRHIGGGSKVKEEKETEENKIKWVI